MSSGAYSFQFGQWNIMFTQLQAEEGRPKVFACRIVPMRGTVPFYGFGETEAAAVVDLLRAHRDNGSLPSGRNDNDIA